MQGNAPAWTLSVTGFGLPFADRPTQAIPEVANLAQSSLCFLQTLAHEFARPATGALPLPPRLEEIANLGEAQPEALGPLHEGQIVERRRPVEPVALRRTAEGRDFISCSS